MKKEVNNEKRTAFNKFLEKMDYRKDGPKAHSFISGINKSRTNNKKPFMHNGKTITDEKKIASLFNTHYTAKYQIHKSYKKQKKKIKKELRKKRAYDTIWRCKLIEKISTLGISGNMLRWITDFTTQRYCRTRFCDAKTQYKQTKTGLPQGAVSSTTLFNVYINDLLVKLEKSGVKVAAFADDIVIWSAEKKNKINVLKSNIEKAPLSIEEME
ncbi:hypothetical protein WDU94_006587 [Cyamophila willieti]